MIILSSGSELQWALDAAKELDGGVRVVSMPCFERFDRQDAAYKAEVLPPSCAKRLAIEAGVTGLWYKFVGLGGKVIGTDKFGFSAPGDIVMKEFGITAENVVEVSKDMDEVFGQRRFETKQKRERELAIDQVEKRGSALMQLIQMIFRCVPKLAARYTTLTTHSILRRLVRTEVTYSLGVARVVDA